MTTIIRNKRLVQVLNLLHFSIPGEPRNLDRSARILDPDVSPVEFSTMQKILYSISLTTQPLRKFKKATTKKPVVLIHAILI